MNLKKRGKYSHKGQNGIVTVIGGSKEYTGAVYLAAQSIASLRLGIDLVYVCCPEKVGWAINKLSPDLITVKLKGDYLNLKHYSVIKKYIDKSDIILIGNGISKNKNSLKLVKNVIKNNKNKLKVIDADALSIVNFKELENSILTPHSGEFKKLLKNNKINIKSLNKKIIKNIQNKLKNNIILLKRKEDYVISKDKIKIIKGGNAGMTVGGTGDVLAGLCTGFSFLTDLFNAALLASKLNKKVGDKLKKKLGYGFIASDFLKEIAIESKRY